MQHVNQNLLIAQVVKFLNGQGYLVWRQENNGRIDEAAAVERLTELLFALAHVQYDKQKVAGLIKGILRKCYRKVPCALLGVTDVIGIDLETGKWIVVEVKIGADELRPDQVEFIRIVREAGGDVWLCREIESFKRGFLKKRQKAEAA